jgi:hypothetical protein
VSGGRALLLLPSRVRHSYSPVNRSASRHPLAEQAFSHTNTLRDFSYGQTFSAPSKTLVGGFIAPLLNRRGPPAIPPLIVTVVVSAVKLVAWPRTVAHVGVERFKRMLPSVAYGDTTTAVPLIASRLWPITPRQHRSPNPVNRRFRHAVRGGSLDQQFFREATA